jgi:GTP-binding protein Era
MAKLPDRCGFIALLGAPNAGKSTLLNALTGSKIAAVSPRPGTTRSRVIGVCTEGRSQVVFIDLPGIFAPKGKLQKVMVETAWEESRGADVVFVLVDASHTIRPETGEILDWLRKYKLPAVLVLNKIDMVKKDKLLPLTKKLTGDNLFSDVLMISATTGDGLDKVLDVAAKSVPEGVWQYPEDHLTDLPERLWAAEITREQVFIQLEQELPYAAAVETELWEERSKKLVVISQVIYVERDGQKAIVLGKGGSRIKAIGTAARQELEKELGRKIHLTLHVKVKPDWAEDTVFLREQGLLGSK